MDINNAAINRETVYLPVYTDPEVLLGLLEEFNEQQRPRLCKCGKLAEYFAWWRDEEPLWICADCCEADMSEPDDEYRIEEFDYE